MSGLWGIDWEVGGGREGASGWCFKDFMAEAGGKRGVTGSPRIFTSACVSPESPLIDSLFCRAWSSTYDCDARVSTAVVYMVGTGRYSPCLIGDIE